MLFFVTDLYIMVRRFGLLLSLHQLKKPLDVTRDLKAFKLKCCTCCMHLTRENLSACKAFVDFWDDHVIIPSVQVFYRHPSLQKKPLMVMCLMSNNFIPHAQHFNLKVFKSCITSSGFCVYCAYAGRH